MPKPTHAEIIAMWPTRAALARDLGQYYVVVQGWYHRNNIPRAHWASVVAAAQRRGFPITRRLLKASIIKRNDNG